MKQQSLTRVIVFLLAAATLAVASVDGAQRKTADESAAPKPSHENPRHADSVQELARLRNEGVAHFESGIGLKKALARFEQAVALRPDSAIETYNLAVAHRKLGDIDRAAQLLTRTGQLNDALPNAPYALGLIHRARGDVDKAVLAFERARALAPTEASVHYQLGRLYREQDRAADALQAFIDTLQLDPHHTGAMYQLYLYYQQQGEADRAKQVFDEFSRVKRALSRSRRELNDDETALVQPIGGRPADAQDRPARGSPVFAYEAVKIDAGAPVTAFDVRDVDADGHDDIIAATRKGEIVVLQNHANGKFATGARLPFAGNGKVKGLIGEILARDGGVRVIVASDNGIFVSSADLLRSPGTFKKISARSRAGELLVVDVDHDGDLDVVSGTFEEVLINQGNAAFTAQANYLDRATRSTLNGGSTNALTSDLLNAAALDFVFYSPRGARRVLRDDQGGRYALTDKDTLAPIPGAHWWAGDDMDNDGRADLVSLTDRALIFDYNNGRHRFTQERQEMPPDTVGTGAHAVIADFDNDGWKDVLVVSPGKPVIVWRNLGGRRFVAQPTDLKFKAAPAARPIASDIDGDGRIDVVALLESGELVVLRNNTAEVGRAMRVELSGQRSAPSGRNALVEVRRGAFYAKYESAGRALHVALGDGDYAEIVRITWPNGFIESKFKVDAGGRWIFPESERVSGSCPSVFAWDGERFHFVTDAFISGPMGVPLAQGRYFPVDHDEYVKIPGELLRAVDGRMRIALTEELREAVYLDEARLYAVDHPEGITVYPNEYLAAGEFPEFKIHATAQARPPVAAVDQRGDDVLDLVRAVDRRYPASFSKKPYAGLAEFQGVALTLPPGAARSPHLRLFLTGWFYYFESTSLIAAAQRNGLEITWPQIQVARGDRWETVMQIGIPSGKDKTVVVDLAGRLPPDAERIRIWTNLELYWDQILVDTGVPPETESVRLTQAELRDARLRFRGFSRLVKAPDTFPQPERFDYHDVHFQAPWNPLHGRYTRYGDVRPLLDVADSRMAVFGSGDELMFEFDAGALPELPRGWRRDYFIYLNGYVKDGDRYTAHAGAVDPMPYAGMREYPYTAAGVSVFSDATYRDYLEHYQTRAPLRFTGPSLAESAREHPGAITGSTAAMRRP